MSVFRIAGWRFAAALLVLSLVFGGATAFALQPGPPGTEEGVEILARGPVHEAFAETVTFDPQPGIVVSVAPPAAIEELPPEVKPEGDNVAWIPGYWAWDDDNNDFLWVSGIWRALPPGRQWVSGYWAEAGQGAQWISGYWADAQLTEVEYLPEPPASVEVGPNIAAPSENHIWLPGGWVWNQSRYAWRPGFWSTAQPNWVWVPAHYLWAPRGYVYVDGYWDYEVRRRGILFAPVSFQQSVYSRRGFSYTPSAVINLGVFASHLFLRPNYGHYYYGDYYGANYATAGFQPWHSFHSSRHGYDPIYSHQRWNHRQDNDWERRVRSDFQHRRDHKESRPPRTFAAQQELVRRGLTDADKSRVFAQPLEQFRKDNDGRLRFESLNTEDRQRFSRMGLEARKHREERRKLEAQAEVPTTGRPAQSREPARIRIPKSPLTAKPADQLGEDSRPPKSQALPEPDPRVVPKSRPKIEPKSEPNVGPRPKVEPKPTPNVGPRPKVEPKPTPNVGPRPRVEPKPAPNVGPRPKVEPKPAPNVGPRPRVEPKPTPNVGPKPRVEPKPAPNVGPRPRVEPKPAPNVGPRPRVEPKPAPNVGPRPRVEPKPRPNVGPRPRVEPKPTPNVGPRPRVEPKPTPNVGPKPRVEPKPAPNVGPRPRVEPKPAPNVGPRPRVEPKPAPNVGPRPRVEPKPAPNVGPRPRIEPKPRPNVGPRPRVEPKPAPRPEPKPKAEPKPKNKPKEESKSKDEAKDKPRK